MVKTLKPMLYFISVVTIPWYEFRSYPIEIRVRGNSNGVAIDSACSNHGIDLQISVPIVTKYAKLGKVWL